MLANMTALIHYSFIPAFLNYLICNGRNKQHKRYFPERDGGYIYSDHLNFRMLDI